MASNGSNLRHVIELQNEGVLLVEDGNHGEYRPRREEFVDVGTAFIRAADMDNGRILFQSASKINETALQRIRKGIGAPGDVLLSHKGTVGKVALALDDAPPFVCSPQTTFWRTLDPTILDRCYLYAYLCSADFHRQLASRKGETDMADYVSLTAQRELLIPVPDIRIQQRIAAILGTLDNKIELNRRMNENLETITRRLFKNWFNDFDQVHAKAAVRQEHPNWPNDRISRTSLPRLDPKIAALFSASFENSPIGNIPKGWRVGTVGDIVLLSRDSVNPGNYTDETFCHFSIPAFDDGQRPTIGPGSSIKSNKFIVSHSCVLLSKLNPRIPRVWLPDLETPHRAVSSTEFLVMLPAAEISREYLYCLLSSESFSNEFTTLVTGTSGSHQRVRPESLLAIRVLIPPAKVVEQFTATVKPILDRMVWLRRESKTLAASRDKLLPRLLSGELSIKA